jgi:hypothetical protein
MTLNAIIHVVASIPKAIQNPSSTIALPLSSMAVAYASSLPSKPQQDQHGNKTRKQGDQGHAAVVVETNSYTKRFFTGSSSTLPSPPPVMVQTSSDRTIDPYLGNLLNGFCNGSCYKNENE